jgi:hypothetical protein
MGAWGDHNEAARCNSRLLVATYQGYPPGTRDTPFLHPILKRLIERGHALRIIFGPGVRQTRLPVSDKLVRRYPISEQQWSHSANPGHIRWTVRRR